MMLIKKWTILFGIILLTSFLYSEEDTDPGLEKDNYVWGVIFNTSNIFLDIESYQMGFGSKVLLNNDVALRFLFDGFYSSSTDTFSIGLGTAVEKHFNKRRVSPYWGGFINVKFRRLLNETNSDNWDKTISFPISAGAILGVEFFIVENVSLFAEYNLVFEGSIDSTSKSEGGIVTKNDPQFSYQINTGVGNDAKLGIVIYLDDVIKIDRK